MRLRLPDEILSAFDDDSSLILYHCQFRRRNFLEQFRSQDFIERLALLYGRIAQAQRLPQSIAALGGEATKVFNRSRRHEPSSDYAAVARRRAFEQPRIED